MPLARTISPYRAPPKVKPFNADDFIRSLELSGPQLTSRTKGDWAGLYRRFIKSPNFVGWYSARHAEVSTKLTLLHMESLSEARIECWMEGKAEVELVDMVLRYLHEGRAAPPFPPIENFINEHDILGTEVFSSKIRSEHRDL